MMKWMPCVQSSGAFFCFTAVVFPLSSFHTLPRSAPPLIPQTLCPSTHPAPSPQEAVEDVEYRAAKTGEKARHAGKQVCCSYWTIHLVSQLFSCADVLPCHWPHVRALGKDGIYSLVVISV